MTPMPLSTRFSGRCVLVTGATGGIGQAAARRLAEDGASLVLTDQAEGPLAELAASFGPQAITIVGDVTREETMDRAVRDGLAAFGRIDGAFLNAGMVGRVARLGEAALADFERVMAVNVGGCFIGLSKLMPLMTRQGGGSIVLTSSTAGLRGSVGLAPYVASKHAVLGLMRCAALEGAAAGVRVNALHPGPIDTVMIHKIERGFAPEAPEIAGKATIARVPLKRYGTPEEVAALLAFVLSDEASFCTGSAFSIDGGIMAGSAG
ncbi:SDR family oxidoreductase [Bosea sp. TND4EK4]|uniref:SDR family NAD(P)-dependent oxidoreductase n=1 Tax=Bosea sp. TND4EK4 TaxID=1907408 RepID=UPI000953D282|nr:SDR family oxidoreductase [Bosea sp. TND4EK4]SIR08813.1 NAD(P)-dependent dehydrogenase, short-chain alcohol dehydrogenase family [Bosea sp. TND4EK4]